MYKVLFSTLIFLFLVKDASAQVVINEFSSSTSSDWVELYAFEDTDISGWILDDEGTASDMKTIPDGVVIGPSSNSFYVVEVSNRLNNSGDVLSLLRPDRSEVDKISYGNKGGVCTPSESASVGRYPDANTTIERFAAPSKGESNNNAQLDPCPSPTPQATEAPEPTPKPTSTPKPSSTPKPTSKPKNTPTKEESVLSSATISSPTLVAYSDSPEDRQIDSGGQSLGVTAVSGDVSSATSGVDIQKASKKFPLTAGVFIITGISFLAAAVYSLLRSRKKLGRLLHKDD